MAQGRYNQGNQGGWSNRETQLIGEKKFDDWIPQIRTWVKEIIDKDTITFAESMGKQLKQDGLTTSQIRNVFGEMRKIQMNGFEREKSNFLLLRAKLAYATSRQQAKGLDNFYKLFCVAYDAVDTSEAASKNQYERLLQIMEAVLAYHKFYGGQ